MSTWWSNYIIRDMRGCLRCSPCTRFHVIPNEHTATHALSISLHRPGDHRSSSSSRAHLFAHSRLFFHLLIVCTTPFALCPLLTLSSIFPDRKKMKHDFAPSVFYLYHSLSGMWWPTLLTSVACAWSFITKCSPWLRPTLRGCFKSASCGFLQG